MKKSGVFVALRDIVTACISVSGLLLVCNYISERSGFDLSQLLSKYLVKLSYTFTMF